MGRKKRLLVVSFLFTLLFFLLSNTLTTLAQDNRLRFEYVFDLGSPSSQVIIQDSQGFLWFGSAGGGMIKYDGYNPIHYKAEQDGLSNSFVYGIVEDVSDPDILWIATKEGLNRFNKRNESFTYYKNEPGNPNSISHNAINQIIQDSHEPNVLWLATELGLNRFDKENGTFERFYSREENDHRPSHPLWRISEDVLDKNILWLGTWGYGLERFDKRSGLVTSFTHDVNNSKSLGAEDNIVAAIQQDKDDANILWIGTLDNGLDRFNKNNEIFTHHSLISREEGIATSNTVGLIYDDGLGQLWLGGYRINNGLYLYNKSTGTFENYRSDDGGLYPLPDDDIVNVFKDNSGIYWLTSYSGKAFKVDRYSKKFTLYQHLADNFSSLSNSEVTVIYEDSQSSVWVGTRDGLNRMDSTTAEFSRFFDTPQKRKGLGSGSLYDILEDSQGYFWASFFTSPLIKFDKNGEVLGYYDATPADSITKMVVDPFDENILWLGTRGAGFARFDIKSGKFKFYFHSPDDAKKGPGQNFLYTILHDDQENVIWMGGWEGGGLSIFDKSTELFEHFIHDPNNKNSLSSNSIADIFQDSTGTIWIGTIGGGLEKFNKSTKAFTQYSEAHGVPMVVNGILEDENGYLWLSTDSGIVKFDVKSECVLNDYHQADGLQGEQFTYGSAGTSHDGLLWFGGSNGLNVFDPLNIPNNPFIPPLVLTSFSQGGEAVPLEQSQDGVPMITLDWQSNYFEFEYVALNFTNSSNNQYAYILEGLDKEWFHAGTRRFGRYTSLPPGEYILRIKGSNNDGMWNEEGIAVHIRITPPFWKSWWFYALCIIIPLGLFLAFYRTKSIQLKKEREAAETLRISEERLSLAIMGGELGLWDWDIKSGETIINQRWAQMLGYQIEEIKPTISSWQSLLHPDDINRVVDELNEHIGGATPVFRTEYRLKSVEGEWKWIQDIAKVVERDKNGKPKRVAGVHIDITERKRMEENMLTSKKLAELGTLSAGIAHEINSPLQIITGISESIAQRLKKSVIERDKLLFDIDKINRNGWRIAKIVRSLLTFARSSATQTDLHDLNDIIQDTLLLIEHQLSSWNNVKVETKLSDTLPKIICERNNITQLIINLITNARDAMPDGGKILIQTEFIPESKMFKLQFSDNGIGIPEDIQSKIFDPFFTTKPVGKGTGLGLSVVLGTVRTHGGYIQVDSKEDQGTTFNIFLPEKPPPSVDMDNGYENLISDRYADM